MNPEIRFLRDGDDDAPLWATCVAQHRFIVSLLRIGMAQRDSMGRLGLGTDFESPQRTLRVFFECAEDALMWKLNF